MTEDTHPINIDRAQLSRLPEVAVEMLIGAAHMAFMALGRRFGVPDAITDEVFTAARHALEDQAALRVKAPGARIHGGIPVEKA